MGAGWDEVVVVEEELSLKHGPDWQPAPQYSSELPQLACLLASLSLSGFPNAQLTSQIVNSISQTSSGKEGSGTRSRNVHLLRMPVHRRKNRPDSYLHHTNPHLSRSYDEIQGISRRFLAKNLQPASSAAVSKSATHTSRIEVQRGSATSIF